MACRQVWRGAGEYFRVSFSTLSGPGALRVAREVSAERKEDSDVRDGRSHDVSNALVGWM